MTAETQRARAMDFRERHDGPSPLVLPCAWDAASARLFEEAGFPAIGTTSAGIANSIGYPDGQAAPVDVVVAAVERIADAVSVPVSADFEAGYGGTPAEVVENVDRVITAGAVGLNLEDGSWPEADPLVDQAVMVDAIEGIRRLAADRDVPVVLNARTDVFLRRVGEPEERFDLAVDRANAFRTAGADCLFVPGVADPETIERLTRAIDGPVNVLASHPDVPPVDALANLGVARVSVGPGPMYAAMAALRRGAETLYETGSYPYDDAIPYPEMQALFADPD